MGDKIFIDILMKAVTGDMDAIQIIIEEYGNIINKYSYNNGKVDEDCKQHIKAEIIKNIKNFKSF